MVWGWCKTADVTRLPKAELVHGDALHLRGIGFIEHGRWRCSEADAGAATVFNGIVWLHSACLGGGGGLWHAQVGAGVGRHQAGKEHFQTVPGQACELVFTYTSASASRGLASIPDLRFHDLRHEAISRLSEPGYSIEQVAPFSLHESWASLKSYKHLNISNIQSFKRVKLMKYKRDLGKLGESWIDVWCSSSGLIANGSAIDKTGWDFYIEFPFLAQRNVLQLHASAVECKVQVKATDGVQNQLQYHYRILGDLLLHRCHLSLYFLSLMAWSMCKEPT